MCEKRVKFSKEFNKIRENLHFILVNTESQGNIGSAARALKTGGFKKMILVNPPELDHPDLRKMAHRSRDIIENVQIFDSFDDAIAKMRFTIGTTMRKRQQNYTLFSPQETAKKILSIAVKHPVAIIFGNERNGLSNKELSKCNIQSTIPTATQKPALNLAQAVMLYAHYFFINLNDSDFYIDNKLYATNKEYENFYKHLANSLKTIDFNPRDGMDAFIIRVRRIFGKLPLESRDIKLLHKLLQLYDNRIIVPQKEKNRKI